MPNFVKTNSDVVSLDHIQQIEEIRCAGGLRLALFVDNTMVCVLPADVIPAGFIPVKSAAIRSVKPGDVVAIYVNVNRVARAVASPAGQVLHDAQGRSIGVAASDYDLLAA